MAFVDIPKDLNRVKSRVLLGLTKEQLIGFGLGAVIGGIVFFTTKAVIGVTASIILMMILAMPCVFYGIYDPPGLTLTQQSKAMLKFWFASNGLRPYKTENIYNVLAITQQREVYTVAKEKHKKSPNQAPRRERKNNQ